jgi:hypothetical protein
VLFAVGPQILDRVQFRRVGRKKLQPQASAKLVSQVLTTNTDTGMCCVGVQDGKRRRGVGAAWWLTERVAAQAVSIACAAREISNNAAEANAMPAER